MRDPPWWSRTPLARDLAQHAGTISPMTGLLAKVPKPLYDDIARGYWLPLVGAGLSRNAIVSSGAKPPDWNGLASVLRAELADPDDTSDALDVISAYAHEHGRPALVERVAQVIRLADAGPAGVHRSLCRLPLDVLITTNFDNLLEEAFRSVAKPCHAVLDEPQLGLNNPFPGPTLLKIHGDVSRPDKMILTEKDFDTFLMRNPLMGTVVASHFAQRSAVRIGYSLSDPDLRQLLAIVSERLGRGARAIYSIEVDPSAAKVSRFARRGVRVVNLPGDRNNPGATLEALFNELYEAIGEQAAERLKATTHESGLALRAQGLRRSCFLATSVESNPHFNEWLGPVSSRLKVPLLSIRDFIAPNESTLTAIDSMLAASGCAIVEHASPWTSVELGMALNRLGANRVLLVSPRDRPITEPTGYVYVAKPESEDEWAAFAERVKVWWSDLFGLTRPVHTDDHSATIGEILSLTSQLENLLGDLLASPDGERMLGRLVRDAEQKQLLDVRDGKLLREFVGLRNKVAHGQPVDLTSEHVLGLLSQVRAFLAARA